jgi:hypothetical protein
MPVSDKEKAITEAVQYYRANPGSKILPVAKLFNVDRMTLSRRINHGKSLYERPPTNLRLKPDQNKALIHYISRLHDFGVPLRVKHVENAANTILAIAHSGVVPPKVSERWASRWIARHPQVKKIRQKAIEIDRQKAYHHETIKNFFQTYDRAVSRKRLTPDNIWNVDEMGIRVGVGRGKWVVVPAAIPHSKHFNTIATLGETEHCTLVEAISAAGRVIEPLIVIQGKIIQHRWFENLPHNYLVGVSESAYVNDLLCFQWIQHFNRLTKPSRSSDWRLLLLDGYESHLTLEFIKYCDFNRIEVLQIPPHSTHFMQPLDVGVFQVWKHWHSEIIDSLIRQGVGVFDRQAFLTCIEEIRVLTFKEDTIRSAWRKTGYLPYNPDIVLNQIPRNVTPEPAVLSDPGTPCSHFGTPKTYRSTQQAAKWLQGNVGHPRFESNLQKFCQGVLATQVIHQMLIQWAQRSQQLLHQKRTSGSRSCVQKGGVVYSQDVRNRLATVEEIIEKWANEEMTLDQIVWRLAMRTFVHPQLLLKTKARRDKCNTIGYNCQRRYSRK